MNLMSLWKNIGVQLVILIAFTVWMTWQHVHGLNSLWEVLVTYTILGMYIESGIERLQTMGVLHGSKREISR